MRRSLRNSFATHLVSGTIAVLTLLAPAIWAQGVQTGSVIGQVDGPSGDSLPGVTITATSEALLGTRSAQSGPNGDFVLKGLPIGDYRLTFSLESMTPVERAVVVDLGRTARADATLQTVAAADRIDVTDEGFNAVATEQVTSNYTYEAIDLLPIDREPISIAELSAGVSSRGAVDGQVSISGGIGYDNLVMLDGVDNSFFIWGNASGPPTFGSEVGLFIEDAIEETQILTAGVSAEYGRFTGGVINAITKRGGNRFRGSFRIDMTNPSWREESPLEDDLGISNESNRNELYSATLGGYVVKDRLWFFLAGSNTSRSDPGIFPFSGAPQPNDFDNQRYQLKLNASLTPRHSFEAITLQNSSDLVQSIFGFEPNTIDSATVDHDYLTLGYTGVLGSNSLLEARYSEREVLPTGFGGSGSELRDSPFIPISQGFGFYNAPVFDESDPSLNFDDENLSATYSRLLSTEQRGSHDLKIGFERFTTTQRGGNSQASSEFLMIADFLTDIEGAPVLDGQGRFQPIFAPFGALAINLIPDRDAVLESTTQALFVNDTWRLNDSWSFNLGVRYEQIDGDATPAVEVADFDELVPRLSATYHLGDSGKMRVTASYGEYLGRANSELFKKITTSRNSSEIDYLYVGPPGVGIDFDPGFDLSNYVPVFVLFPTANAFFEPGLSTPRTAEIALSFAAQIGNRGYVRAALVNRSFEDGFEDFIELANGTTVVDTPVGPLLADNVVYRNTDLTQRDYLALQLQGRYRLRPNWTIDGHWTWEIENDGNFVGEEFGNPAVQSVIGNYPEILVEERHAPSGPLPSHQEHKLRAWSHYAIDLDRGGALDLLALLRFDSPLTYSHEAFEVPVPEVLLARDPGYATPPATANLFFGGRGGQEFESWTALDLSLRYAASVWNTVEPWLKLEVRNIFDSTPKRTFNTSIIPDFSGPVDANGLPTQFLRAPTYGEALSPDDFYPGREILISLGVRF